MAEYEKWYWENSEFELIYYTVHHVTVASPVTLPLKTGMQLCLQYCLQVEISKMAVLSWMKLLLLLGA